MCTLTIIPTTGIRAVCNRDESRLRPAAVGPQVRSLGSRLAVMPIDPVGGGTWIGASDAGLAAVLMNVYGEETHGKVLAIKPFPSASAKLSVSRGTIIPQALRALTLDEAVAIVRSLDHTAFEPFRLVVADRSAWAECLWTRSEFSAGSARPIEGPLFFTSSGLGDEVVAGPRRRLFDEMFATSDNLPRQQDAFHRHAWPDNRPASVWMTREQAMTVSRTEVELTADHVTMSYHARVGDTVQLVDAEPISLAVGPQR
jgi:hypothetical protein